MLVGFIFFLTLYLQNALGFDALQTGVRSLPMMALVGFSAPIAGRFISKTGPTVLIAGGMASATAGAYLVTLIGVNATQANWTALLPSFVLLGVGPGCANAPLLTVAVGTVEGRQGRRRFGRQQRVPANRNGVRHRVSRRRADDALQRSGRAGSRGRQRAEDGDESGAARGAERRERRPFAIGAQGERLPDFPQISRDSRSAWIGASTLRR